MDRVAGKTVRMLLSDKESNGVFFIPEFKERMCEKLNISETAARSCIQHLQEEGLIVFSGDSGYYFILTHKIRHLRWFAWDAFRRFVLQSVLVPILVSILTTYALWALGLMGK